MTYLQKKLLDINKQINPQQQMGSMSYRHPNNSHFESRYIEIMETELQDFEQRNEQRPKIEENLHLFRHMWHY
jgi:hypothetical protein